MAGSVVGTSAKADVIFYADDDQYDMYHGIEKENGLRGRTRDWYGPRIGPVSAANVLAAKYPEYSIYGMVTDDAVINTPGWDEWCLESIDMFPNRICVISPYHDQGNHVDMPFVTKEWMKKVGFFACPRMYHYCWPIITGLIGEMTAIVHAPQQSFGIVHKYETPGNSSHLTEDALAFYEYVAMRLPTVVERLRAAMHQEQANAAR